MTQSNIRLATWNLRYDTMPDNTSIEETLDRLPGKLEPPKRYSNVTKEYPWSERRIKVAKQLLSEDIVLAGKELLFYSFLLKKV